MWIKLGLFLISKSGLYVWGAIAILTFAGLYKCEKSENHKAKTLQNAKENKAIRDKAVEKSETKSYKKKIQEGPVKVVPAISKKPEKPKLTPEQEEDLRNELFNDARDELP